MHGLTNLFLAQFAKMSTVLAAAFVTASLPIASVAAGQEGAVEKPAQTATHRGEVVTAFDGKLTMTIEGKNQHTHQVVQDAVITLNGRKVDLNDLMRGDIVTVTTAKDDSTAALKIAATRKDADDARQVQTPQRSAQGALLGVIAGPAQQGTAGAVVLDVMPDGPADKANVRRGDVVTSVGGQAVASRRQLTELMQRLRPGQEVELVAMRNGQRFETKATLGDPAKIETQPRVSGYRPAEAQPFNGDDPWLGVWLRNNEDGGAPGAVVGRVYPTSPAAEADLEDGDRIVAMGDQEITSAQQFVELVGKQKAGDRLELKVQREGREQPRTVAVTLARRGDFLEQRSEFDDELSPDSGQFDDPLFGLPEHVVRMEHERRMAQQHQRLEELMLQVLREVRDLRQEVNTLRGGAKGAKAGAESE